MKRCGKAILIVFFLLLLAAIFYFLIFAKKKVVSIEIKNPIDSMQDSEQRTMNNEQQTINSEQVTSDKKQETKNQEQETVDKKSEAKDTEKIVDKFVSWGFEKVSGRKIDTIIIHSSYDALGKDPYSIDGIIAEYKQYGVAAHYLIARDGTTYQLVENKNIAYHAGKSKVPDGRTGVNKFSIGIEMVNTEDGKFTDEQYSAVNQLIASLKKQYAIKYVLGHSDIAPDRKTDPWNIDWTKVQK